MTNGHSREDAEHRAAALRAGEVLMLENLLSKGRELNDPPLQGAGGMPTFSGERFWQAPSLTFHGGFSLSARRLRLSDAKELQYIGGALDNPKRRLSPYSAARRYPTSWLIINLLARSTSFDRRRHGLHLYQGCGGSIGKSLCEDDNLDNALDFWKKRKSGA
jgi:hypothetical protein